MFRIIAGLFSACLCLALSIGLKAQTSQGTLRLDVNLVNVFLTAQDSRVNI
jgi:hypothetical protein